MTTPTVAEVVVRLRAMRSGVQLRSPVYAVSESPLRDVADLLEREYKARVEAERERDRWKLQSEDWQKRGWEIGKQTDALQDRAESAERERDAASEHARQQDERVLRLTEANEALIRERDELRAEIANLKDAGCEYRVTSHEGTSYCQLAESAVKRLTEELAELRKRVAEAPKAKVRGKIGELATVCVSHDLAGKHVAIVPLREGE